jgi:hypothetical protein
MNAAYSPQKILSGTILLSADSAPQTETERPTGMEVSEDWEWTVMIPQIGKIYR